MKVFVYATLKKDRVLEEALGERHGKVMTKASLPGFVEQQVAYDHDKWPTLWAFGPDHVVRGEVFDVTDDELAKLDRWENNYKRQLVKTSEGPAYTYFFKRPGLSAAIGGTPRLRSDA